MNGKRIYAYPYLAWQPFTRLLFSFFFAGFVDSPFFGEWLSIYLAELNQYLLRIFRHEVSKKVKKLFARHAGIV